MAASFGLSCAMLALQCWAVAMALFGPSPKSF
jgi:hypothetical protein